MHFEIIEKQTWDLSRYEKHRWRTSRPTVRCLVICIVCSSVRHSMKITCLRLFTQSDASFRHPKRINRRQLMWLMAINSKQIRMYWLKGSKQTGKKLTFNFVSLQIWCLSQRHEAEYVQLRRVSDAALKQHRRYCCSPFPFTLHKYCLLHGLPPFRYNSNIMTAERRKDITTTP